MLSWQLDGPGELGNAKHDDDDKNRDALALGRDTPALPGGQPCPRGRRPERPVRGHLHRPGPGADGGRPSARRGHAAHRPAGGDGTADRRADARAVAVRAPAARSSAFPVSEKPRPEGDARRGLAGRHSAALVADRHGDRPQAGAPDRQGLDLCLADGHRRAVRLRRRARLRPARHRCCRIPTSA